MDPELVRNPPQMPDSSVKFTENVISTCIAKGFKKSKTKVAGDAVQMMEWATRVYVLELLCRCAQEAQLFCRKIVRQKLMRHIWREFWRNSCWISPRNHGICTEL
ncbi:uncharacterized protein LOC129589133 isoform X2 [Paramacrobiotus metropolitanus]|nr:uncharacterized protein LOC129589133 isoform X2 [Paramacrobiotus metropolitanus]